MLTVYLQHFTTDLCCYWMSLVESRSIALAGAIKIYYINMVMYYDSEIFNLIGDFDRHAVSFVYNMLFRKNWLTSLRGLVQCVMDVFHFAPPLQGSRHETSPAHRTARIPGCSHNPTEHPSEYRDGYPQILCAECKCEFGSETEIARFVDWRRVRELLTRTVHLASDLLRA